MTPEMLPTMKIVAFALVIIGALINYTVKLWIKVPDVTGEEDGVDEAIKESVTKRQVAVKIFALWLVIIGVAILFIIYR
jgi:ABC-type branched-subunit amino acid transport system permease subunit